MWVFNDFLAAEGLINGVCISGNERGEWSLSDLNYVPKCLAYESSAQDHAFITLQSHCANIKHLSFGLNVIGLLFRAIV